MQVKVIYASICISVISLLLVSSVTYGKELKSAPDFQLTDQTGKAVRLSDFRGKIVVMDWIFTRCTDVCVMQTKRFKQLQDELKKKGIFGEEVVLLSITMDPKYDTPKVLKSYAKESGADTSGWYFLTGDFLSIYKVARDYDFYIAKRFPKPETEKRRNQNEYIFSHQEKTYIIDQKGNLVSVKEDKSLAVSSVLKDVIEIEKKKI